MSGNFLHNVDAKGRVFIPAKYRSNLGETVHLVKGVDGCIRGYSDEDFDRFCEALDKIPDSGMMLYRKIISQACDADVDSQGRILIPERMRAAVEITEKATICGVGCFIELWSPDRYADAMNGISFDNGDFTPKESELLRQMPRL